LVFLSNRALGANHHRCKHYTHIQCCECSDHIARADKRSHMRHKCSNRGHICISLACMHRYTVFQASFGFPLEESRIAQNLSKIEEHTSLHVLFLIRLQLLFRAYLQPLHLGIGVAVRRIFLQSILGLVFTHLRVKYAYNFAFRVCRKLIKENIPYGSAFARETGTPIALSAKGASGVESATIHSSSSTSGTGKFWFERPSKVPSQMFSRSRFLRSFTIFFASASANSSALA